VQKYNVQSLENKEVQRVFRNKIIELSADEENRKGIEKQWSLCEKIMKEATEAVTGMQGPLQRNDWFDDECAEVTFLKNKAHKICWPRRIQDGRGKNIKRGDMRKRNYIGQRRGKHCRGRGSR
jgi:hypothetical protein